MSSRRRQLLVLVALLAVLGVVLALGILGGRLQVAGDLRPGGGLPDDLADAEVVAVEIEGLEAKPGRFSPGRDPFRFHVQQAPKPVPQPRPAAAPPPQQAERQAPPPQAATPAKPTPPPIDFDYLGSFGPDGRRIAVFTDRAEIYNAQVGEVIKEKFVVRNIGYESADIGFVDFPNEPQKRLAIGG